MSTYDLAERLEKRIAELEAEKATLAASLADEKSSSKAVYERAHMLERQISELRSYAVKRTEQVNQLLYFAARHESHWSEADRKLVREVEATIPEICTHRYRILGGACAQCGDVTINGAGTPPRNEVVVADSSVPGKAASPLEPSARPSGATNECVHQVGRQPRASFDAFRWMGDLDAFEKWYGQRCPVDHGGQISVPCGRPEGAYLRVWCGSWIVRQSDGKCHTLRDDTMRYMLDEYYPGEYEALTCHAINSHPSDEGHQP